MQLETCTLCMCLHNFLSFVVPISKRCIETGTTIMAIICKKNTKDTPTIPTCPTPGSVDGNQSVTCCLLTGEQYKIPVTLNKDSIKVFIEI